MSLRWSMASILPSRLLRRHVDRRAQDGPFLRQVGIGVAAGRHLADGYWHERRGAADGAIAPTAASVPGHGCHGPPSAPSPVPSP